jgi:hypothetical protein
MPGKEITNRAVFFVKLFGSVGVTLVVGMVIYFRGKRRNKDSVENYG